MKVTLFVVLAALALEILGFEFPALPSPEFADTEASTNFTFAVNEGGGRRLVFLLEPDATTTNNVEIAIGYGEEWAW